MPGLFFKREASQLSQRIFIWIFSLCEFGVSFVKSCAQWGEYFVWTDVLCLCFSQLTCSFLFWNPSSLFSELKGMYLRFLWKGFYLLLTVIFLKETDCIGLFWKMYCICFITCNIWYCLMFLCLYWQILTYMLRYTVYISPLYTQNAPTRETPVVRLRWTKHAFS